MALDRYPMIVVTGASGWLGRRVVNALREGHEEFAHQGLRSDCVRCLVPPGEETRTLLDMGTEVIGGDIRDSESLRALLDGAEGAAVIHLAGVVHPGKVSEFAAINTDGTAALLEVCRSRQVARLVVMSSNSPCGYNARPEDRFTEESPYQPYMGYGHSKWKMELHLRDAMQRSSSPEIVIIRAPWFYGPGQPPRQTLFFTMTKEGKFPIVGSGQNRRSMSYVDSLAYGILLAVDKPEAAGQIYWIADERPYPMTEIVDTVRAVLRDDFSMPVAEKTVQMPGIISDAARLVDAGLQGVGLYHQKIHVLSEMNLTIACDIAHARRHLGYEPLLELREGMRRSVQWCLDQGLEI